MRHFVRGAIVASLLLTTIGLGRHASALTVSNTIAVGSGPSGVTFSPDGTRAYVTNNTGGTVSIIDTATETLIGTVSVASGPSGVVSSGTKVIVNNTAANGHPAAIIDRATNAVSYVSTPTLGSGSGVALSPDGSIAWMAAGVNIVRIDLTTNIVTKSADAFVSYTDFVVLPTGDYGYATSYNDGTITKFDLNTLAIVNTIQPGFGLIDAQVAPDSTKVYVARCSGSVLVYDVATDTVTNTIAVTGCPYGVDISPSGSQVFVSRFSAGKVSVIDTATGTLTEEITVGSSPSGLGVSPDGTKVYVANAANNSIAVIGLPAPTPSTLATTTSTSVVTSTEAPTTTNTPVPTTIASAESATDSTTVLPVASSTATSLPTTGRGNDPALALLPITLGVIASLATIRRRRSAVPT